MAIICAPGESPANRRVRARCAPGTLAAAAANGSLEVPLRDGTVQTVLYAVRRRDDCFAAALSTTLQIPISEVPDPHLRERRHAGEDPDEIIRSGAAEMKRWLAGRGLRMVVHRTVPVARRRWIGIVPAPGWSCSHSLVMSWGEVIFDPATDFQMVALAKLLGGVTELGRFQTLRPRKWGPEHVRLGLSFQKLSKPTTGRK
jgi:hypothetical protein